MHPVNHLFHKAFTFSSLYGVFSNFRWKPKTIWFVNICNEWKPSTIPCSFIWFIGTNQNTRPANQQRTIPTVYACWLFFCRFDWIIFLHIYLIPNWIQVGRANHEIEKIVNNLSKIEFKNQKTPLTEPLNPAHLIPENSGYWTYQGSLTTPPCFECVTWIVFHKPIEVSNEQVSINKNILGKRLINFVLLIAAEKFPETKIVLGGNLWSRRMLVDK